MKKIVIILSFIALSGCSRSLGEQPFQAVYQQVTACIKSTNKSCHAVMNFWEEMKPYVYMHQQSPQAFGTSLMKIQHKIAKAKKLKQWDKVHAFEAEASKYYIVIRWFESP